MGTYVEYRPCSPVGPIEQIAANLGSFVEWYASDFVEDACNDVLTLAHQIQEQGANSLQLVTSSHFHVVDRMVGDFYGYFADIAKAASSSLPPHFSCAALRIQRYRQLHHDLAQQVSAEALTLIRHVTDGRPIAPAHRSSPYISDDGAGLVGWWTLDEVQVLQSELTSAVYVEPEFAKPAFETILQALHLSTREKCGLVVTAF